MNFLIQLAWAVFFAYASRAFAKSPTTPTQTAASASDIDAPIISEGVTVPVFAGTCKLDGQNVSWFGGLASDAVTQGGVVTGYKYRLTVQLTFGFGPIDGIKEIRFEDNAVAFTSASTGDYIDLQVNAPTLFGGDDKEGGVSGTIRVYKGTTTQTSDIEMSSLVGAVVPAYRRVCYAVARNFYWGMSPRLKPFSLVAQRWPNQLAVTDNQHRIGDDDANPVCVLYELLTDQAWGAAEPESAFNLQSWRDAATQVWSEGLGVSIRFATGDTVEDLVKAMLRYIDGTVYEDPETGQYTLLLVRDMIGANPPVLDKTHVSSVEVSRISWSEVRNTVKVTFTDRERNYETGAVQAQQSAALASTGNVVDLETIDLPAFHGSAPADFVARRALRALSYPMSKVQVRGDRSLAALRPGQAFVLQWERPSMSATYRIQSVDMGTLTDRAVTINAIEDAFSTDRNTFVVPPVSSWEPTSPALQSASNVLVFEQPYRWTGSSNRALAVGVQSPSTVHTNFRAALDGVLGAAQEFSARGTILATIPQWSTPEISVTVLVNIPSTVVTPTAAQYDAGEALLLIGEELLAYRTVTRNADGTVTFGSCARAAFDTVPREHVASAECWVLPSLTYRAGSYTSDTLHAIEVLTATSAEAQAQGDGTVVNYTTVSRAARPAPPGLVLVNGTAYPTGDLSHPIVLTWPTRNRTTPQVVLHDAANITPESSTTYVVRAYNRTTNALLATYTPSTATATIDPSVAGALRVEVAAVRSALESYQAHLIDLNVLSALGPVVGLLHFDGSAANSISGGPVFTLMAGASVGTTSPKFGSGMLFGGVECGSLSASVAGDFSVDFWAWTTGISDGVDVLMTGLTSGSLEAIIQQADSEVFDTAGSTASATGWVTSGVWTHYEFSRTSGTLRLFKGGTQIISRASTEALVGDVFISVECYGPCRMDELRIAVGAGSGGHTANFTPPTSAYTP